MSPETFAEIPKEVYFPDILTITEPVLKDNQTLKHWSLIIQTTIRRQSPQDHYWYYSHITQRENFPIEPTQYAKEYVRARLLQEAYITLVTNPMDPNIWKVDPDQTPEDQRLKPTLAITPTYIPESNPNNP